MKTVTLQPSQVVISEAKLRDVKTETASYEELVASMKVKGCINLPNVRLRTDDAGEEYYELVDGLHRLTAMKDAGIEEQLFTVLDIEDNDQGEIAALEAQIIGNANTTKMTNSQYCTAIKRIYEKNEADGIFLSAADVGKSIGKSASWVTSMLGLARKIKDESIIALVDEGEISLVNVHELARLPKEEQLDYLDQAKLLNNKEFTELVSERLDTIKKNQDGSETKPKEFVAKAKLHKASDLLAATEDDSLIHTILEDAVATTPEEAAVAALKWALNLDPATISAQKAAFDANIEKRAEMKRKKEEEKAKRKLAALDKKKAEAEAALADMNSEALEEA